MLANISTRGLVQTGDEAMIGGFILQGETEESTVVVRAIGPSLTSFGIGNALADPTLELHDANGALIQDNDNWKDEPAQADELIAIGFAPGNDLEPAMVATLPPGAYTAIVAGKVAALAWRWSRFTTCSNGGQLSSSSHDGELRTPGKANQLDWR